MHTNNISKRRFTTCENELKYLPSYPELQNASKISKEKNNNLTELQFSRKFSLLVSRNDSREGSKLFAIVSFLQIS